MVSSLCQKETNLPGGSNSGPPGWRPSTVAHSPTGLLLSDPVATKTTCVAAVTDWVGKCLSKRPGQQLHSSARDKWQFSYNSFASLYDQYRPILLARVQMSIKTIILNHYFYHWPVRAIIYVQFHNVCYSV